MVGLERNRNHERPETASAARWQLNLSVKPRALAKTGAQFSAELLVKM